MAQNERGSHDDGHSDYCKYDEERPSTARLLAVFSYDVCHPCTPFDSAQGLTRW